MKAVSSSQRRDDFAYRWNGREAKHREDFYHRWIDKLDCLFAKLGLTAVCTACWAVFDPQDYCHRDACPQCGKHEIVTPYGG